MNHVNLVRFCANSSSHRMLVRIQMEFVFTVFSLSLYSHADGSIEETISTSTKKKKEKMQPHPNT